MSRLRRPRRGGRATAVGGAAFLFFLAKGIIWLIVFAAGAVATAT